jgi:hypothetical protein
MSPGYGSATGFSKVDDRVVGELVPSWVLPSVKETFGRVGGGDGWTGL